MKLPKNWDEKSHILWLDNKKNDAIQSAVKILNQYGVEKPKHIFEQLSYYSFLLKDYQGGCFLLEQALTQYPNDIQIMRNLAVFYSRMGDYKKAIFYSNKVIDLDASDYVVLDTLANVYSKIGNYTMASQSGTNSLILKDKQHTDKKISKNFSNKSASDFVNNKKRVISFALWGDNKRYLYGALRNLLLAHDIYPGWELWFYVDNSVPKNFINIIKELGGIIHIQENGETLKEKLCWRFKVANNQEVGYFIVRDVDSVISVREFNAVQEWIQSDKLFHIIRDWWSHTDLILAGLWGGVAGVLPNIDTMLKEYTHTSMETQNIDQWFLRDSVWSYVKENCLIHDRCFAHHNSVKLPGKIPSGYTHIGSDEFAQNREFQEKFLSPWLDKINLKNIV